MITSGTGNGDGLEYEVSTAQIGTFGLGYVPTKQEIQQMRQIVRDRKKNRLYHTSIEIPDIRVTFPAPAYVQLPEVFEVADLLAQCEIQAEDDALPSLMLNTGFFVPLDNTRSLLE